jgi:hypothetical protein
VRSSWRIVVSVGLDALAVFLQTPAGATGHSDARSHDEVYFRSVLCFAPPYNAARRIPTPVTASTCSASSRLDAANLGVTPSDSQFGYSSQTVPPDAALAGVPSTSPRKAIASATVLLPGFSISPKVAAQRYVLGPAEMTSASVARASVTKDQTGQWAVNYTMTKRGAVLWDKVTEENFHKFLGIDLDGLVLTAPIIQPSQTQFTSFDGRGEISGNLNKSEAFKVARDL